jgi:hypothetical protein
MRQLFITFQIILENLEGKRPIGRPRYRCKDIIMNLREIGLEGMD